MYSFIYWFTHWVGCRNSPAQFRQGEAIPPKWTFKFPPKEYVCVAKRTVLPAIRQTLKVKRYWIRIQYLDLPGYWTENFKPKWLRSLMFFFSLWLFVLSHHFWKHTDLSYFFCYVQFHLSIHALGEMPKFPYPDTKVFWLEAACVVTFLLNILTIFWKTIHAAGNDWRLTGPASSNNVMTT